MEQSRSLYRILLEDQAPAAAAYTESRADSCFSPDSGQVQLRVFVRQHHNGTKPLEKPVLGSQGPPWPGALPDGPEWDKAGSLNLLDIRSPANLVEFFNVSSRPNSESHALNVSKKGKHDTTILSVTIQNRHVRALTGFSVSSTRRHQGAA
jgi:hypothetical protein